MPQETGASETAYIRHCAAVGLFGFLMEHEIVFKLLDNQQISVAKAIESLVVFRAGNEPSLPEYGE